MFSLHGAIALITGSSQGIGFALAEALAKSGAEVVINGRDATKLKHAASQLQQQGYIVHTCCFDVADINSVRQGVASIENNIGNIDILVNNAGMQIRAPLDEFDEANWRTLFATNVDSVFYVSKAVANFMIPRGRGKIINIASVQSELARPGIAPYTATKGAVKNLTKGMCADWAKHGIQVNAIGPGYFDTPLNKALVEDPVFDGWLKKRTPAGRWGQLEELHGAAIFLASPASNFVNGQTLYVDGGIVSCI